MAKRINEGVEPEGFIEIWKAPSGSIHPIASEHDIAPMIRFDALEYALSKTVEYSCETIGIFKIYPHGLRN